MTSLEAWKDKGLLTEETMDRLRVFSRLIQEWNPRVNLTGFRSAVEIESNLIGESISALFALKPGRWSVLDFGSGAGIPGLVWQICQPSLAVTSLEIRQKKIAFQKEVRRLLKLDAEIVAGWFPDAVSGRRFDCIVSRAIRFHAQVWDQALPLLNAGGCFVRFGGANAEEDGWRRMVASPGTTLLVRP